MSASRSPDASGDLQRYPFPRLLFYLAKKAFVGELSITPSDGAKSSIYFRDGMPVYSDLKSNEDILGRVLLERGWIDDVAFNQSLAILAKGEKLQGRILMEMGVLDEPHLVEGLIIQLRRKLNRVFFYKDATFELFSGDHSFGTEGEAQQVRVDPLSVIYHGVRNAFDLDRLKPELEKLETQPIIVTDRYSSLQGRYGMTANEIALGTLLSRGAIALSRVLEISHLGPVETLMVVYVLWISEVLQTAPDAASSSKPDPAADSAHPRGPLTSRDHPAISAEISAAADPPPVTAPPAAAAIVTPSEPAVSATATPPEPAVSATTTPPEPAASAQPAPIPKTPATASARPAPTPEPSATASAPAATPRPATTQPSAPKPAPRAAAKSSQPKKAEPRSKTSAKPTSAENQQRAEAQRKRIVEAHARMAEQNFYEVLGVTPQSSVNNIRDAYFALAKEFHPDRVTSLAIDDVRDQAADLFRQINEAHSTLTDPQRRKEYEERLEHGDDAEEEVRNILEAEFAFQQGVVFFRKKNFKDALAHFKKAANLNPDEGEHLAWLAWTIFNDPSSDRAKVTSQVKQDLLAAAAASPKMASCHYFLGEVYLAMNEEKRAVTCFNRTLDIQPHHIDAKRQLRLLTMRQDKGVSAPRSKSGLFRRRKA